MTTINKLDIVQLYFSSVITSVIPCAAQFVIHRPIKFCVVIMGVLYPWVRNEVAYILYVY